jgi:hypothetical protein
MPSYIDLAENTNADLKKIKKSIFLVSDFGTLLNIMLVQNLIQKR